MIREIQYDESSWRERHEGAQARLDSAISACSSEGIADAWRIIQNLEKP